MIARRTKHFIILLLINFFIVNAVISCDCAYQSVSEKYLKSEIVLVGKIKKAIKNPVNKLTRKWSYELIETIKGIPLDTIISGLLCNTGFREGDEVLIYGIGIKDSNTIVTNSCRGSKRINRKEYILHDFEIKALRYHKKHIGERIDNTPIKYNTKIRTMALNPFRMEFYNIRTKKCRAAYVLIKFSNTGKVKKIQFLNRVKRKVKKSISEIVNEEDVWINKTEEEKVIIRCFLYPSKRIDFIDF